MVGIYFSGTGNSKYCIEDKEALQQIQQHDEIVFAFPVQYSSLPKIVHDFIKEHSNVWENKRVFIISTMGLFSGDGSGVLARLLKRYGATIIGGLHIRMPDSIADEKALKKSLDENERMVQAAKTKIIQAAQLYKEGRPTQTGLSFMSHCFGLFTQRLYFGHKTKKYTNRIKINREKCHACGTCASLCPMHNILLQDHKIITKDQCTMCYRCVNACPKQAITLLGKNVISQWSIKNKQE